MGFSQEAISATVVDLLSDHSSNQVGTSRGAQCRGSSYQPSLVLDREVFVFEGNRKPVAMRLEAKDANAKELLLKVVDR